MIFQNLPHKLCKCSLTNISNLIAFKRRYLYDQYNYTKNIEEVVNIQIQAEQQASQDYLNLAVTFLHPSKSFLGAGGLFIKMYKEELDHMRTFINYQLLRGGIPTICGLEPPVTNKNITLLDAFKQSLHMEMQITKIGTIIPYDASIFLQQLLEEGIKKAESLKDYHYADFVTSVFLAEQIKSIHEISHHVTKLTALGSNQHALYHYDVELAKMYPYSFKI